MNAEMSSLQIRMSVNLCFTKSVVFVRKHPGCAGNVDYIGLLRNSNFAHKINIVADVSIVLAPKDI